MEATGLFVMHCAFPLPLLGWATTAWQLWAADRKPGPVAGGHINLQYFPLWSGSSVQEIIKFPTGGQFHLSSSHIFWEPSQWPLSTWTTSNFGSHLRRPHSTSSTHFHANMAGLPPQPHLETSQLQRLGSEGVTLKPSPKMKKSKVKVRSQRVFRRDLD